MMMSESKLLAITDHEDTVDISKDALFFTVYLLFWSGDKILARYLDNSYVWINTQ